MKHLPECRWVLLKDLVPVAEDGSNAEVARVTVVKCAEGCPMLAAARENGRELAARFGW